MRFVSKTSSSSSSSSSSSESTTTVLLKLRETKFVFCAVRICVSFRREERAKENKEAVL